MRGRDLVLSFFVVLIAGALVVESCFGAEETDSEDRVEAIAGRSRDSVVVILATNREGERGGLGTGFVVREDGVIATNFHVIRGHRPFSVQMANGDVHEPTAILAFDRKRDLAVVKIEKTGLPALELGDSDSLREGQTVLAVGNPLGLEHSVSRGVIAGSREVNGNQMIQIAIPIEPGSSGSPVLDLDGRVVGILAIKSAAAIGFAVPGNNLRTMIASAQAIPMARWRTIGALDRRDWNPLAGGSWRQRGGTIIGEGQGDGFAGRMLCLSRLDSPVEKFELEVEVRLEDESGAAGLAFHADGAHKHYGFYPTAGSMRLTRFEGPDVFRWTILDTVKSSAYQNGEWNRIGVRVVGHKIICLVNDEVVIEKEDRGLKNGRVGLVKFREPTARFRRFRVGAELSPQGVSESVREDFRRLFDETSLRTDEEFVSRLSELGPAALTLLESRAVQMEKEANRLRELTQQVHLRVVHKRFTELRDKQLEESDLFRGALLISSLDNPELDIASYERLLDRMAEQVRMSFEASSTADTRLAALIHFMYDEWGFHPSRADYYHRSNSYVNEVLDDREGIPITLSIVFIELGRRLDLPISGIGVPRHFIVRYDPTDGSPVRFLDVFNRARTLERQDIAMLTGQGDLDEADLKAASNRSTLVRVLRNLISVADLERDDLGILRYLDAILALQPESAVDRWIRAVRLYRVEEFRRAAVDLDWLIEKQPEGVNLEPIRDMRKIIRKQIGS